MKSSTLLDCIAFQLTPTRTRCDLVVTANGKTEKIASGLLDPFLAHLKAAQDQIGKGGYSIVLEPNRGSDTQWFTKGTVARFVRFVSTPEILERACTIESEILQIEKAISLQRSKDIGPQDAVDLKVKSENSLEGSKPALGGDEEKAIVLYEPAHYQAEEHGSTVQEKNSKVQLVQVLETRKIVLQKEQGMAFARAVAASFDINNIAALLAFAECFGASRMMDACKKFVHLWKVKHESGQWVEIEATEAISYPAEAPLTNSSGIVLHSSNVSSHEATPEKNGKSGQHHLSQQNPLFTPWQTDSQANGMPVFQPYPMQGMPYFQNYPGNNMFIQSPYPDPRIHPGQRTSRRRHSMDSEERSYSRTSTESETQEADTSGRKMQDNVDTDEEVSVTRRRRYEGGKSSKNQSGKVVIRNINYIASSKQSASDSRSNDDDDDDDDGGHIKGDESRKFGKKDNPLKSFSGDNGNWQAFQNFLLTDADESSNSVSSMLAMEGKFQGKKRETATADAASSLGRHNMGGNEDFGVSDQFDISGDATCMQKRVDDQMLSYGRERNLGHGRNHVGQMEQLGEAESQRRDKGPPHGITDESFVVLHRAGSLEQVASDGRAAMDMDYQLPLALQNADNNTVSGQHNHEANELNLMPNRAMEDGLSGYDPAMDYEMQAQVKESTQQSGSSKKVTSGSKQGLKKSVKDQKLKAERTSFNAMRASKLTPSEDARARAEKLRAFKADLQKLKKEKEEEQLKRLEALKIERQKRIAAKSGGSVTQIASPSQQSRKQLAKYSPISQKGSKFSDTEPGSSSPLQRSTLKLLPRVSSDPSKVSNSRRSNSGNQSNGNRLTRSASSLSLRNEENKGPTSESKATTSRIRRLSEPKSTVHHISSGKTRSTEAVSRRTVPTKTDLKKIPTASIQKKSIIIEKAQNPSEKMISSQSNGDSNPLRDGDDNTIVEKTVVMLEFKKPSTPILHQSENDTNVHGMQLDTDNNVGMSEEYTSIPLPASPIIVKEVDCEPSGREVKGHSYSCVHEPEEVSPNLPNIDTAEESYQAPYARVSSSEDRCMIESEYGKALPTNLSTGVTGVQTATVCVSDGQRQDTVKIPQAALGKHQVKESKNSPKGFRRLLKFGKKSSTANDSAVELDKTSGSQAGNNALNGSSSEVFTLKNLLTQEESSSAVTTPKKSSRSFSLLSPFKSKSAEKKAAS